MFLFLFVRFYVLLKYCIRLAIIPFSYGFAVNFSLFTPTYPFVTRFRPNLVAGVKMLPRNFESIVEVDFVV